MSYATLIDDEGINQQFLILLKPRRQVTTWTNTSGSIYRNTFTLGEVTKVTSDGVSLTLAASSAVAAGEFYFDSDNSYLYISLAGAANPSTKTIVATYEFYCSTIDAHWHRDPLDAATRVVYWEPIVAQSPNIQQQLDDIFFGVLPSVSTGLTLNNADKILNEHLYYGSFNKAEIIVWHWLEDLEVANLKKVFVGRCGTHTWTDRNLQIAVQSSVDTFDREFRLSQTLQKFTLDDYPNLNTIDEGNFIRYVYGVVEGLRITNIDIGEFSEPTTSDNRIYAVCGEGSSMYAYSATVPASPSSTTTRTYLNDATGFTVGDSVWINKATDEYRTITLVDYASNYIEHEALVSGAAASTNTVSRGAVSRVEIYHSDQQFLAMYSRDYTESVDSNGVLLITLNSGIETALSIPETLSGLEDIAVKVYGKQNNVTLGGPAYGSNDSSTGNLLHASIILLDILKRYAGLSESDLDAASFTTALTSAPDKLGFCIPDSKGSEMPTIKELVSKICATCLLSFYLTDEMKWKVSRLGAPTTEDGTIEDDEIIDGSLSYAFDYTDLYSDFRVDFRQREKAESDSFESSYLTATAQSTTAKYVHEQDREMRVESLHYDRLDAETLALRLSRLYGDRQGILDITTKNRLFEFSIDEVLQVNRESLPGFSYSAGTNQSVNLNMRSGSKGLRSVKLTLNDLKGVTDNSGDF